ncbi:MAG: carbohydrate ABC transporter permease [Clostridiales bacterium]|jgi:multiple sugar transport system permease protein/putative aldouronate transport system permease protein|nr:carbohydrate ABC transporter permease [Clostridiales bacterium]
MDRSIKKRKNPKNSGPVQKQRAADYVFHAVNISVFLLFTLLCFFPFYYLFINTISNNDLVAKGSIVFVPRGVHFGNYLALGSVNSFFYAIVVTVSRTVAGTLLMVLVSSFAGYIFTQRKMWKRKFWYRFVIIPMYFSAGLIPWYTNMLSLGLTNNYFAYILPGLAVPFNIILVKTYIEAIPPDIEESARIDGAGTLTLFFRVVGPLTLPILATITIFGAVGHWNSFQDSLILMNNPKLFTLQHRLYTYLQQSTDLTAGMGQRPGSDIGKLNQTVIKYTIAMVSIIPIVLVYPFMQRYFIKGIMMGAVKG